MKKLYWLFVISFFQISSGFANVMTFSNPNIVDIGVSFHPRHYGRYEEDGILAVPVTGLGAIFFPRLTPGAAMVDGGFAAWRIQLPNFGLFRFGGADLITYHGGTIYVSGSNNQFNSSYQMPSGFGSVLTIPGNNLLISELRFSTGNLPFLGFNSVDNIVIYPVAPISSGVPELSTWAMMILGFACLAVSARRRTTTSGA